MSGYQTIVVIIAVASAVAALLFSSYLILGFKSPSRPAIRAAAIAAALGALAFSAIALTAALTPELYEIRGLPTLITGVPVAIALAYVARKQAKSMRGALNRPRVQSVLFWAGLTPDERTISTYATAASSSIACSYSDGLR